MAPRRRDTIGLVLDSHMYTGTFPSWFYGPVIRGVQLAAQEQGVNLMIACGIRDESSANRYRLAWPTVDKDIDFVPVGPWNTDGLLVFSPLRTERRIQYIRELREKGFPLVFIGSGSGGPTIMPDNEGGIRQALEHLVGHGHRAIAFIAGDPEDSGDSLSRVEAYRRGVRELHLSDDPRLLEYGLHWDEEAYRATRRLLASGVRFSAVMCSNDFSSLGVVRALKQARLRIPWDVAVTGFDDQPEALVQIPPLTSVRYPLFETGYRALMLIRKRIEEGPDALPATVCVSTRLMTRQSCGCFPDIVTSAALPDSGEDEVEDASLRKEKLTQAMLHALQSESVLATRAETSILCDQLVDGFLLSLEDGNRAHLRVALIQVLQQIESMDDDAHAWQAAISVLRIGVRANHLDSGQAAGRSSQAELAEDLLHMARTLLSESTRRRYVRQQLLQTYHEEAMGKLTAKLLSAVDHTQIYSVLAKELPKLGVPDCRIAFFEPKDGDPVAGSVIHSAGRGDSPLRCASRAFPPPGLFSADKPFSLALLPLFFKEERMGYVAFDAKDLRPLATIAVQVAAAIKRAQLHDEVLELSLDDSLTGICNRRYFEIFVRKEAERSCRFGRDLAVVMIDIDRFAEYNDQHGRSAGDEALKAVSSSLSRGARRGLDTISRYSGGVFAVILPETDQQGALTVVENLRRELHKEPHPTQGLTLSAGVASMRGEKLDADDLVRRCELALRQAKKEGRGCTVVYQDGMWEGPPDPASES
jgi:diguanylate cyclase (GGDEF)-like protein